MKTLSSIIYSLGLLLTLQSATLQAEQVQIYNNPPSAAEMGQVLFGQGTTDESPNLKMRSISFGVKTQQKVNSNVTSSASTQEKESGITSVGLPIKFAYNSDEILEESIPFLEEVGKMLNINEYVNKRLVIEGHTDAVGSASFNLSLSQRRANAVKHYLISKFEISAARLKTKGMGESKPLAGYDPTDEANRRVQFYSANL